MDDDRHRRVEHANAGREDDALLIGNEGTGKSALATVHVKKLASSASPPIVIDPKSEYSHERSTRGA